MEKIVKNKRVQLVEETFGITLPEFTIHSSCREFGDSKDNNIPDSAKWKHTSGATILPPELEIHLPKEGMNPEQAIAQLEVCSSLSQGVGNDAYQLYTQEVMMRFLFTAITNCVYLASRNYESWNKPVKPNEEDTFLQLVQKEMWIFHEAFRRERPKLFIYQRKMGHQFLRLLLENNALLEKGTDMGPKIGIYYNTVEELLMVGSRDAYGAAIPGHDSLYMGISKLIGLKCYELTEQLLKL